jgi:hypothetical protein
LTTTLSTHSRNALASFDNGICAWHNSNIPCSGTPQSFNVPEPTTGCGIMQENIGPYTFGSGQLGFANTGYLTTLVAGQDVEFNVKMTAYHGGRFEFRLQDLGTTANADPDGSKWSTLPLLRVNSFSPPCDNKEFCGVEPCIAEKTCAQIPMLPYGDHDGEYKMVKIHMHSSFHLLIDVFIFPSRSLLYSFLIIIYQFSSSSQMVTIPEDAATDHAVLQWRYVSANSCHLTKVSCDQSEIFWNCAGAFTYSTQPTTNACGVPFIVTYTPTSILSSID